MYRPISLQLKCPHLAQIGNDSKLFFLGIIKYLMKLQKLSRCTGFISPVTIIFSSNKILEKCIIVHRSSSSSIFWHQIKCAIPILLHRSHRGIFINVWLHQPNLSGQGELACQKIQQWEYLK